LSAIPQFDLQRTVRRWDLWRRLQDSVIWVPRGILVGVLIGLSVAVASRLQPWLLRDEIVQIAGIATLTGFIITLLGVWVYPRSIDWLTRYFDQQLALKERLSTTHQLMNGIIPPAEDLQGYQIADTQRTVERVNLREQLPIQLIYRDLGILLVAVIALIVLLQWDNAFADEIVADRALDNTIQQQADELENLRDDILSDSSLTEEQQQELIEPLNEALETLENPEVSQEEAVAAVSEAQQELEELAEGFSEEERQAFEQAGQSLQQDSNSREAGEPLEDAQLSETADELNELGSDVANGDLNSSEQESLAEQLDNAAEALESTNPEASEAFSEASDALQNGDNEATRDALNDAAEALREQQQAAQETDLSNAAEDAAERLEDTREELAGNDGEPSESENSEAGDQSDSEGNDQSDETSEQDAQEGSDAQDGEQQQSQQGDGSEENQGQAGEAQENQQGQPQNQQGQQGQQPGEQNQAGQQQGQQGQAQAGEDGQAGQQGEPSNQGEPGQQSGQEGQANGEGSQGQQQGQSSGSQDSSDSPSSFGAGDSEGGAGQDITTGPTTNEQMTTDNNPDGNTDDSLSGYDSIFAPQNIGSDGNENEVQVDGQTSNEDFEQETEGDFNEEFSGEATTNYGNVYADYADDVNQALDTDYIPLGLKDVIRQYFSSLEPNSQ